MCARCVRLTGRMQHQYFRQSWTLLWDASVSRRRPPSMSIRRFLSVGLQLVEHLEAHHAIEEHHVFPYLATRMPEFAADRGPMVRQHREIHAGMDRLDAYLRQCASGEKDLELDALRAAMEGWGAVLLEHLDAEVRALGAENMRKYWTKDEIRRMPM